ncbi:MAG TPA: TIGR00300 family protein [Acidimicrobiales bacterium]|nr:TIGR00300 family protein [Acidimicrobiales bacterium]
MATETIVLEGHIVDSLILAKVLDAILDAGADYSIIEFAIGRTALDVSRAVVEVNAADEETIEDLLAELQVHGANRIDDRDAALAECTQHGVLPAGFYVTTNLATEIRVEGHWVAVSRPEMDCAIAVAGNTARTVPMHLAREGDRIVVGHRGVRVHPLAPSAGAGAFEFMSSDVSTEKPKAVLLERVVERLRAARDRAARVLVVCGPAVIHTGGGPHLARLVRAGWVDVLFAGNGFATHDMESNVFGTSLGVSVQRGHQTDEGHANHLRVINEIRRWGSIAAAVEAGYVTGGVMFECVRRQVPFVLGGSVRDDGPLPDTVTDVVTATDMMRSHTDGIGVGLVLATTLHGIAAGNILPATVETFCVDISPAVVTKLTDRGTHQAIGIVTDVGPFLADLADQLTS